MPAAGRHVRVLAVLGLLAAMLLAGPGVSRSAPAMPTAPSLAPTAAAPRAIMPVAALARVRPRALLTYTATLDARGRMVVRFRSNAKKVTVTYRTAKPRSRTMKLRSGSVHVIVPQGAKRVRARAEATRTLRASKPIALRPTPVPPTPKPPPAPPPPPPPPPPPSPPPPPPPPRGGIRLVPLPPIGPASPDAPPPNRWYEAMQTLNCALIGDTADPPATMPAAQRPLFASLAQVCLTLTGQGQSVDWTAAARAVDESASETNCWIVAVRGMLSAAVAAHAADPTAQLQAGPAEPGTACAVGVRDITAASSPPGGAYTLRIQGPYLFQVTGLTAGGAALDWVAEEDLGVDPPLVTLTATGFACLPAGQQVSVTVSGQGYQASAPFRPRTSLGACSP